MSGHRSHFRNVRFFDEANPDVVLGGLIQNGSLTEKNFLTILQMIVLVTTAPHSCVCEGYREGCLDGR